MVETSVLNVDQKNHTTLKAVMVHVAAVIATKSIFLKSKNIVFSAHTFLVDYRIVFFCLT